MPSRPIHNVIRVLLFAAALMQVAGSAIAESPMPAPPGQPRSGPGGLAARYATVDAAYVGSAPEGFWLFTPSEAIGDTRSTLPVVLFLHGFTAVDPAAYRGWIDHIVRRGAVVIYPDYQTADPFEVPWANMLPNVVLAARAALAYLRADPAINADTSRMVVIGHSLGGVLAVSLAAVGRAARLPEIPALMIVQPGGCDGCGELPSGDGLHMPDLATVSPQSRLLMIVGEDDEVVGDRGARIIWNAIPQIPPDRRDAIIFPTDRHGTPALEADHSLPQTGPIGGSEDALDWFGTWKLFDLLGDCVWHGQGCDEAMNDSPAQNGMGTWSDGTPVLAPEITDSLPPLEPQP